MLEQLELSIIGYILLCFFGINAAQTNHKNRLNYVAGSPDTTKEPYCDDCIISSGYTVIQWLNDRVRAF